ncbi:MAG: bifunctional SulP family inorganic anion transporter/carbonic anhydrase [Planctomycetaceae bacterium]|nr:bifunctional SulP family inorganic anion transporter/carbonic anhydrase [Planctomycetaceae bacterium]
MPQSMSVSRPVLGRDLTAGMVVFFVALPLCLGVALASNAPVMAGLVSGAIGGIVVGLLSGSHTSVSGPSPAVTAIVLTQIAALGSFEAFLLAVLIAGLIQIILGIARAGFIAAFFPSSVIKGLLAAVGIILILKQFPHLLGHDTDPEGEMSFEQPDHENTISELGEVFFDIHPAAAIIGIASLALLVIWDWYPALKRLKVPAPLVVVMLGVGLSQMFAQWGSDWAISAKHLVEVPVTEGLSGFLQMLHRPDFSQWRNPAIFTGALTIAAVSSLETLLNLEAVDKLDPKQRTSPASRELLAQGVGNLSVGLLGGIPISSVIVRSSVNINAGAQSKLAAIVHGALLLFSVLMLPNWLNMIPISCLAAILFYTGVKLASPMVVREMWRQGRYQFIPFVATVFAIVFTDLLIGVLIGLGVSLAFILNSNLRHPIRQSIEKQLGGEVVRVELANQVSFLNRAALLKVLDTLPRGSHLLLDARRTDYIDPDVLDLIRDYRHHSAPARGIDVSLLGFRSKYRLRDQIQYLDHSTRELQAAVTPADVLRILKEGHDRFRTGRRLTRDLARQVIATAQGQHPLAVVLSCIDSRAPTELIFDLGVGDVFSIRVAGNIPTDEVLGSMEYSCAVAGAKLVLVMGHTRCGAVSTAVQLAGAAGSPADRTGCQHIEPILREIQESISPSELSRLDRQSESEREDYINEVARANVRRTVESIIERSDTLAALVQEERIAIVGALYDVKTGDLTILTGDFQETPAKT